MHETPDPANMPNAASSSDMADGRRHFEETYTKFARRLRNVAVAKFHVRPDDAESLVQDVFATYFMHASAVEDVERYLIGAICNASRKHLQRSGNVDELLNDDHIACPRNSGDAVLTALERRQLLARVLARVGPRCRDFLLKYYWRGESTASIAMQFDSTPGSVHVTMHKCRRRAIDEYRAITEKR